MKKKYTAIAGGGVPTIDKYPAPPATGDGTPQSVDGTSPASISIGGVAQLAEKHLTDDGQIRGFTAKDFEPPGTTTHN